MSRYQTLVQVDQLLPLALVLLVPIRWEPVVVPNHSEHLTFALTDLAATVGSLPRQSWMVQMERAAA